MKDPTKRLGSVDGVRDIIGHAWFEDMNKDDILNKKVPAPYLPKASGNKYDVSNFD